MAEGALIKSGLLTKRGRNFPHRWQERCFKLYQSKLEYYANGTEGTAYATYKGECAITSESQCHASSNFPDVPNAFKLVTGSHQLLMRAVSEAERDEWIQAISNAIKSNRRTAAELLQEACRQGRLEDVREQILAKVDIHGGDNSDGVVPLLAACGSGNVEVVKALLAAGAHVSVKDQKTLWTPLHHAAVAAGGHEIVQLLLSHYAPGASDIDAVGSDGLTPLDAASFQGNADIVGCLLAAGANPAICGAPSKWTSLHFAAAGGHSGAVEVLVRSKADIHAEGSAADTPLMLAAQIGRVPIVLILIAAGARVGAVNAIGNTPLHVACLGGHEAVADALLVAGANIHAQNGNGMTPLHCACLGGSGDIVAALLKGRADIHATVPVSPHHYDPLYIACVQGHEHLVAPLLAAGAKPDSTDSEGKTVLMTASQSGCKTAVAELLHAHAQVNATNSGSNTALIFATFGGHVDVVSALLSAGAYIQLRNSADLDALAVAVSRQHEQLVKILLEAWGNNASIVLLDASSYGQTNVVMVLHAVGVDINCADANGNTPLLFAAKAGHTDTVDFLLLQGADAAAFNAAGWTPLHYACKNGHKGVCCSLLQASGPGPNAHTSDHLTPLMIAAHGGHHEVVSVLLAHKPPPKSVTVSKLLQSRAQLQQPMNLEAVNGGAVVDVDLVQETGVGALHFSCATGNHQSTQLLVAAGANINARDANGSTPLLYAAESGHSTCVQILIAAGADLAAVNRDHGTDALNGAASRGHGLVVGMLLAAGADPTVCDKQGYTALQVAVSAHCKDDNGSRLDNRITVGMLLHASKQLPHDEHNRAKAMTIAVEANYPEMVEVLQTTGAKDGRLVLPRYERDDLSGQQTLSFGRLKFMFSALVYYVDIVTDIQLVVFYLNTSQTDFFYLMLSLLLIGPSLNAIYLYDVMGSFLYSLLSFLQVQMLYELYYSIRAGRESSGYSSGRVVEAFLEAFPSALLSTFVLLDQLLLKDSSVREEISENIILLVSLVMSVGSLGLLLSKSLTTESEKMNQNIPAGYKFLVVIPFFMTEVSLRLLSLCAVVIALGGYGFLVIVFEFLIRYAVVEGSNVPTPYRWLSTLQVLISMVTDCVWLGEDDAVVWWFNMVSASAGILYFLLFLFVTPDDKEYGQGRTIVMVCTACVLAVLKCILLTVRVYVGGASSAVNRAQIAQSETQYVSIPVDVGGGNSVPVLLPASMQAKLHGSDSV